jgi:hypothetical protein
LRQVRWLEVVDDLQAAIEQFLAETDDNPKPFVWNL